MSSLRKGDVIDDRYRLDEPIGAGSFGQVWRATRVVERQDVGAVCAVKVMKLPGRGPGSSGSDRSGAHRWLEEPRALAKVQARGAIPHILEANVWDDCAYIAMELLEGTTLAARLAEGPIPWRRALFIAGEIATALAAAHGAVGTDGKRAPIVHRDLKPQNVFLAGPRRVCVLDWGIAQLASGRAAELPATAAIGAPALAGTDVAPVSAVTAPVSAAPVGTPGYMAPETYQRAAPTPANDVFALGVVLYEMLTGRLPHGVERPVGLSGNSSDADAVRSVREYKLLLQEATENLETKPFVPVERLCPDLPPKVASLVERLLLANPKDRPTDVVEAVAEASRFPHGVPDPPYAGLVAFDSRYAGLFFGQEATIERVLARLTTDRAVLLWGPSGSGKSSLAAAGIGGRMDQTLFLDTDGWTIDVVRPSNALADASAPGGLAEKRAWGLLRVDPGDAPGRAPQRRNVGHLVIIDQLEEILDLPGPTQFAFCDGILALLTGTVAVGHRVLGPEDSVRVVATLRDDLEWKVDRDLPALRPLLERRVIAKGVDANFAEKIVAEPAQVAGYEVEGLDRVRKEAEQELARNAATLPVIQFALSEWWARRDEGAKVLRESAWKEFGGVTGALSHVAERLYLGLDAGRQRRLHALMLQFFHESRKQAVPEADVGDPEDMALVRALADVRLVARRAEQDRAPVFEVQHEALALHWTRLREWLAAARTDREAVEELERAATAWARDRAADHLWRRRRLIAAEDLVRSGAKVSAEARAFLGAGRRAERMGRAMWAGAAVVALVAAAGAGAFYVRSVSAERDVARRNAERASQAEGDAKQNLLKAVANEKAALKAQEEAKVARAEAVKSADDFRSELEKLEERIRAAKNAKELDALRREVEARRGEGGHNGPSTTPLGFFDQQSIENVVNQRKAGVKRTCLNTRDLSAQSTKITAILTIAPNGSVQNVSAAGDDPVAARCIENQLRSWRFPAPGEVKVVQIPFVFVRNG